MARGAGDEQKLVNTQANNLAQNASGLYNSASSGYNSILQNPGFSKSQIDTQMNAALTPIAGARADAQSQLGNRAAATRNDAGMVSGQDAIARHAMSAGSQAAYGVQANADQTALSERDKALQGLSGLYGQTLGSSTSLYGQGVNADALRNGNKISLGPLGTYGYS